MTANRIRRPEARVLAEEEFRRFADLMASLSAAEWTLPTDCEAWDVRKIALHVLGSGDAQASFRSSSTNCGAACRSTRRSTRTTGSTA